MLKRFAVPARLLLGLAGLGAGPLLAAPPDAGTLLQELTPTPTLPSGGTGALPEEQAPRPAMKLDTTIRIAVKAVRITGAKAFPEAELQALVADAAGRELTLADLQAYVDRITRHYREAGYIFARAYLPAQEIRDGVVEIAVLEGRLGKLRVDNRSALSDAAVAGRLADLKEGQALTGAALERGLLLLNDLPGVEVRSTLAPGVSVGTTDLDVSLAATSPYAGSLEFDDYGNRYTGDLRLGASFSAGNLAGLADALALRAIASDGMDYGRLAWQVPVGAAGTQAGAAWSDMRYRLGKDFASLHAHGTATIGSLYLLHPFVRSRADNLNGQLNYDRKRMNDDVDATAVQTRKTVDVLTAGLSGSRLDGLLGGGVSSWSIAYSAGRLELDAASLALDRIGHRTAGRYDKLSMNGARLQRLPGDFSLSASLQVQAAGKNLDSSEKMSLGGAQGVRAYPQGEAPADDGWLATLELRYDVGAAWRASIFYDGAEGRLNHSPIASDGDNVRRLAGYGVGLAYNEGDLAAQLGVAWRAGPQPTADIDRSPRVWLQAIKRF